MDSREDAIAFLQELRSCFPKPLYNEIEETQKGIGFALAYLAQADGEVIAGDLARELGVSTARVAALLKAMERNGLATRRASPADARRTVVEITPAGLACAGGMREQCLRKIELLLERVGKEDLDEFIRISRKIKDAMDA